MQGMTEGRKSVLTLLVDDDAAYLEVLKFFLEREGSIECVTANSAKQALELLSEKEFDAIVSDYLMPEMDGLELLKIVRLQGKDVPFIMLTGRGREDVAIQAMNNGADFYIQKGGDPKAQYADLSNMIKKSTMQRQAERGVREGELLLNRLFASIQDGLSILNKDMVIEMVNPTMERWYADSLPLVGKKCYEAYRRRADPCELCPTREALRYGRMGIERITKEGVSGGGVGWLDVYSFPVFDEKTGAVERVIEYLRDVTDEEIAKEALLTSERRYRAVVNIANEGIIAIDSSGGIAFANPRIASMLGYEVEDLLGLQICSLVDPVCLQAVGPGQLHKILEVGDRVELVLMRKDGSRAEVVVAASPVSSDGRLFDGAVAVVSDISELKSITKSMISSEEKFGKFFQTSPQMIMIARASDSTILEVNSAFSKSTGYRADELIGRSYMDLGIVSEDLASRMGQMLDERGIVFDMEATLGTASKEELVVRLSSYRLNLQGQMCTILISCDLTRDGVGAKELRRERDVLKAILESTPNGIVITDLDGMVVECNAAMRSMLGGVHKDEVIGLDVFAILGKEESAKARRVGDKLVSEGVIKEIPFVVTRKDGIVIRAEISATVINDSLGKPLYFVGIVRDATDQTRYQAELERALDERKQMESIIDSGSAVAIRWLEEPGWPVDYVSSNIRNFGYEAADLTSRTVDFLSIVHPEDRDRVVEEAQGHIEEGRSEFEQEYRIVSPDGTVFWVYDRTTVLRGRDGKVESCQGVVVDITDMKDALERLSRTEKQLKLFMDMSPVVEFMKDRTGRYVYVNKRHEELFGTGSDGWVGKTDHEVFPSDVAERLVESDRKVFETGQFHSFTGTLPQEDGPHEYLTYKFLVPNIAGGEDLIAGVAVDLTDQRRYERALEAANEKLNLLGDMTRHDISNQMAVLVGWLDVVREGETDPARLKRFEDMQKASKTVQDLLMFASEYQSVGAEKPVWVPVEKAFENGIVGLPLEGVQSEVDVQGLEVYADPMFERVFRNLVDNSLRHGEKVSRIKVSRRAEGGDTVLVYEDDGVGILDEIRGRIFERGFGKHTGLGLFMACQILGLTGMTVRETGVEGSGARFEIRVPAGVFRYSTNKD